MNMPRRANDPERKLRRLLSNDRGSALIAVAVAIFAVFAFAVLGIDAAVLMTAKTQLQAAADAAALAGASGLLEGDQDEAIRRAVDYSSFNLAIRADLEPVVITPDDVSFPQPDVVRVETHRTAATGDALRTYFLRVVNPFSDNTADVRAVAAARAYDVCSSRCLKPWAIPDRWEDADSNGIYNTGDYYDKDITGYNAPLDVGASMVLKVGNPQQSISPGIFFPVCYPPLNNPEGINPETGSDMYNQWIAECNPYTVGPGDQLLVEPGNMVGPTVHGIDDLFALDPNAQWDPVSQQIINSNFALSPRIGLVPFFDPTRPPGSGRNYVTVVKVGAFFIESTGPGSQVNGRFIEVTSQGQPCPGGGMGQSFVKAIILIE